MQSLAEDRAVARIAGVMGVAAQVAAAYVYLLYPALTVPSPTNWAFYIAWIVLLLLVVIWSARHPWRSLTVPVVSTPAAALVLWFGHSFLGWGP